MSKIFFIFLFFLASISFAAEKLVYKAYVHGIPAGRTTVFINGNKIEVKGETSGIINIFYRYEFHFLYDNGYIKLVEREGKKKRVYEGEKIHKKKPWLPLVVSFFKEDKEYFKKLNGKIIDIGGKLIKVRIKNNGSREIFIFEPKNSKTKKIVFYVYKNEIYPYKIEIYGKKDIVLELVR